MQKRVCGLSPLHVSLESHSQLFSLEFFSKFFQPFRTPAPPKNRSAPETSLQIRLLLGGVGDSILDFCKSLNFLSSQKKRMSDSVSKLPTRHVFHWRLLKPPNYQDDDLAPLADNFVPSRRSSIHPGLTMDNRFFHDFSHFSPTKMLNLSWKKPLSCSWIFAILRQFFSQFVAILSAVCGTKTRTSPELAKHLWDQNLFIIRTLPLSPGKKRFETSGVSNFFPKNGGFCFL